MSATSTRDYWVLHSAYRDKSWRGAENCLSERAEGGPILFLTRDAALAYRSTSMRGMEDYWRPVRVRLETPEVRQPLDSVPDNNNNNNNNNVE